MGHVRLKRSDPRFWGAFARSCEGGRNELTMRADYNIKELALYDLPAMVDHIRRQTGYDKVCFPFS